MCSMRRTDYLELDRQEIPTVDMSTSPKNAPNSLEAPSQNTFVLTVDSLSHAHFEGWLQNPLETASRSITAPEDLRTQIATQFTPGTCIGVHTTAKVPYLELDVQVRVNNRLLHQAFVEDYTVKMLKIRCARDKETFAHLSEVLFSEDYGLFILSEEDKHEIAALEATWIRQETIVQAAHDLGYVHSQPPATLVVTPEEVKSRLGDRVRSLFKTAVTARQVSFGIPKTSLQQSAPISITSPEQEMQSDVTAEAQEHIAVKNGISSVSIDASVPVQEPRVPAFMTSYVEKLEEMATRIQSGQTSAEDAVALTSFQTEKEQQLAVTVAQSGYSLLQRLAGGRGLDQEFLLQQKRKFYHFCKALFPERRLKGLPRALWMKIERVFIETQQIGQHRRQKLMQFFRSFWIRRTVKKPEPTFEERVRGLGRTDILFNGQRLSASVPKENPVVSKAIEREMSEQKLEMFEPTTSQKTPGLLHRARARVASAWRWLTTPQ